MKYITKIVEYSPKADVIAEKIEKMTNEMAEEGCELVSFSCTEAAKAILVFKNNKYKI
ncbi:MAG: hypothetical protein J6B39_03315 [Lachnospiraceae bacterium]|nr:hypothetical protein [Lachnospiraceae bacterium]